MSTADFVRSLIIPSSRRGSFAAAAPCIYSRCAMTIRLVLVCLFLCSCSQSLQMPKEAVEGAKKACEACKTIKPVCDALEEEKASEAKPEAKPEDEPAPSEE